MNCEKCGSPIPVGSNRCEDCGAVVAAPEAPAEPAAPAEKIVVNYWFCIGSALEAVVQEQIADFVTANSGISRKDFEHYMMATGEMATDVGTILYGKEAVSSGLIDELGGLSDALCCLHNMIDKAKAGE